MEIRRTHLVFTVLVRLLCCAACLLLPPLLSAQEPLKKYTVRNGKMFIEVTKDIQEGALDSFITQFNLQELYLKDFLKNNRADSLIRKGWHVEANNETGFIISKPFLPIEKINNPVDRIIFTEKHASFAQRFPVTSVGMKYGYNRFRNKAPFSRQSDSTVTFFLRGHLGASKVMLAGSFNDWKPDALPMQKTDSGWVAAVKLVPGKYWYKFIEDGRWMVDSDNLLQENDGLGNINSIFFNTNTNLYLPGYTDASKIFVAGSFNGWRPGELAMIRTNTGWALPLYLADGTHTYKFIVDGKWMQDPANQRQLPDGEGGFNSYITFGKPHNFQLKGYQNAKRVLLAGSFNNWRPFELVMKKTTTGWELPYVVGQGNHEYKFIVDGAWVPDPANLPASKNSNSLLVINPNYTFRLEGFPTARQVFVAGSFNEWNPTSLPLKKEGNAWILPLHLSAGKHLYKFIVDRKWILDPANKLWEQNEHGTGNSILWFGQ